MVFLLRLHRRGFVFLGNGSHFLLEFIFPFFASSLYVRYCEYSGVHRADSRAEAPSHAACSAVGTLCQPHRSLHTGRERSCHQVGAHRIMINAANSHLTAFIFPQNIHSRLHFIPLFESLSAAVGSERCYNCNVSGTFPRAVCTSYCIYHISFL